MPYADWQMILVLICVIWAAGVVVYRAVRLFRVGSGTTHDGPANDHGGCGSCGGCGKAAELNLVNLLEQLSPPSPNNVNNPSTGFVSLDEVRVIQSSPDQPRKPLTRND